MLKNLIKISTIALVLSGSVQAFSQENPVFEQLKDDMWQMGLEFDYAHGAHKVMPVTDSDDGSTDVEDIVHSEEITRALNI
jgi:hypothetical protein